MAEQVNVTVHKQELLSLLFGNRKNSTSDYGCDEVSCRCLMLKTGQRSDPVQHINRLSKRLL